MPVILVIISFMKDGDAVLMANFRADRAREILMAKRHIKILMVFIRSKIEDQSMPQQQEPLNIPMILKKQCSSCA